MKTRREGDEDAERQSQWDEKGTRQGNEATPGLGRCSTAHQDRDAVSAVNTPVKRAWGTDKRSNIHKVAQTPAKGAADRVQLLDVAVRRLRIHSHVAEQGYAVVVPVSKRVNGRAWDSQDDARST